MVTPEEQALIADRMAEAGISNMGAYMRKMALNGYVLHVDLSDIRELVALQRRCANNLNQVAVQVPSRFMRKIVCRLRLNEVSRQ